MTQNVEASRGRSSRERTNPTRGQGASGKEKDGPCGSESPSVIVSTASSDESKRRQSLSVGSDTEQCQRLPPPPKRRRSRKSGSVECAFSESVTDANALRDGAHVVDEQQHRTGKIIAERSQKQGVGRPRKQPSLLPGRGEEEDRRCRVRRHYESASLAARAIEG